MMFDRAFSLETFFRSGSSLWRFIKYGQGNTPYVNPFDKVSLASSCAPHIANRIKLLMLNPEKLPDIFRERAANFAKASANFPANAYYNYPGDGYLFFFDPLFFSHSYPKHTDKEIFDFFNYLYSYRHLITPMLFNVLISLKNDVLKAFYECRFSIFKDTSFFDHYNYICNLKSSFHVKTVSLELAFFNRAFQRSCSKIYTAINFTPLDFLNNIHILLEGFSVSAVKRILFNSKVTRQGILRSIYLLRDTCSLIEGDLPVKFSSITALQTFHDNAAATMLLGNLQNQQELRSEYTWERSLVGLIDSVSEGQWWLPSSPFEMKFRSEIHKNCVGAYYKRHFSKPAICSDDELRYEKTLVLFSKEAEAEIILFFEKQDGKTICWFSRLMQSKTKYNKPYSEEIPLRLCEAFQGLKIELFAPSLNSVSMLTQ